MTALCCYAVAAGLRWAHFEDGMVVYVGSTCETHTLAPEFFALREISGDAIVVGADEADVVAIFDAAFVIPADVAGQLARLKILQALP